MHKRPCKGVMNQTQQAKARGTEMEMAQDGENKDINNDDFGAQCFGG